MDFSIAFENLNWIAVLAAWVVSMAWGSVWYSKRGAGAQWMKASKISETDIKKAGSTPMLAMMLLTMASAVVLGMLLQNINGWFDGLFDGALIGTALVATNQTMMYLFEQRPSDLIRIDGVYVVVSYALMGLALGLF